MLKEDKSGFDEHFPRDIKEINTGKIIDKAKNLVSSFTQYSTQRQKELAALDAANKKAAQKEIDKKQKEADAEAERDRKKAEKREKQLADKRKQNEAMRQLRIENRKKKEEQQELEKKEKDNAIRKKIKDGHILDSNFRLVTREFIIGMNATTIVDKYNAGLVTPDVLRQMYKYSKSIEMVFSGLPGKIVTGIRTGKFNQNPALMDLAKDKAGSKAYNRIHRLFKPYSQEIRKQHSQSMHNAAMAVFRSGTAIDLDTVEPDFTPNSVASFFSKIVKDNVSTATNDVIRWYNGFYDANLEKYMDGKTAKYDPKNNPDDKFEDGRITSAFFEQFALYFDIIKTENEKLGSLIEHLMHHHGHHLDTPVMDALQDDDEEDDSAEVERESNDMLQQMKNGGTK